MPARAEKMSPSDRLQAAGIGPRWHTATIEAFTTSPGAYDSAIGYLGDAEHQIRSGYGMYIYGEPGVGKTYLAMAILMRIMKETTFRCQAISFKSLMQYYMSDSIEAWQYLCKVPVLLIDRVGYEFSPQKASEQKLSTVALDAILEYRHNYQLPIFITSHLTPSKVSSQYSKGVASLLKDMSYMVEVTGTEIRKAKTLV